MGIELRGSLAFNVLRQLAALNDMAHRGDSIAGWPVTAARPDHTVHTGNGSWQLKHKDGRWLGCPASTIKGRRRGQARALRRVAIVTGGGLMTSKRMVLAFLAGLLGVPPAMAMSPEGSNNDWVVVESCQVRSWHGRGISAANGWSRSHIRPPGHLKTATNHVAATLPETCGSRRGRPLSACTPRIENRPPVCRSEPFAGAGLVVHHNHPGALAAFASLRPVGSCSWNWRPARLVYDTEAAWKLWRELKDRQKHKLLSDSLRYPCGRQKRCERISTVLWTTGSDGLRCGG